MKPRLSVFLLVLSCVLLLVGSAQNGATSIKVTANQVEWQLPEGINFYLEAVSVTRLAGLTLVYSTNGRACQSSVARHTFDIEPAFSIVQDWLWRFQRSGIVPPGATLWWQWELHDDQGSTHITDRQEAVVTDPRHSWQQYNRTGLTLQWYQGEPAFGRQMHAIALQAIARLAQDYGITAPQDIWITVYPSFEKVREITVHTPEWTGGVAYPEYSNIILGIPPGEIAWARQVIPHEVSHLVVGSLTFNCRGVRTPTWLEEGLAVNAEGPLAESAQADVLAALEDGSLPALRTLTQGFSAYADSAGRAYTQSGMVVAYLIESYGPEPISELLAALQSGHKADEALGLVYGFDTTGLDAAWRRSLGFAMQPPGLTGEITPSSTPTVIPTLALWTLPVKPSATPAPAQTFLPSPTSSDSLAPNATLTPSPTNLPTAAPAPHLDRRTPAYTWWVGGAFLLGGAGVLVWLTRRGRQR